MKSCDFTGKTNNTVFYMSFANLRDQCQKISFVEIPSSCHQNHVKRITVQRALGRQRLLMPKAALHIFFSLGLDLDCILDIDRLISNYYLIYQDYSEAAPCCFSVD